MIKVDKNFIGSVRTLSDEYFRVHKTSIHIERIYGSCGVKEEGKQIINDKLYRNISSLPNQSKILKLKGCLNCRLINHPTREIGY